MTKAKVIVNKMLEADDPDDPRAYLDWLGQKVETGPLNKIRFGAHIHTSDEEMIRENARESGIDVDNPAFWDEVERCVAIMESNALQVLRESGLHVSDEGHGGDNERVASVWIDTDEEDRRLALLKAVINWAEGDWPSTSSGTMDYAFGADTTQRLYAATEDAARFIDVTIEFTGTDALVEWSKLNLNEAITGDPDDPEVFLRSYVPRMMGRLLIEFNVIKPHFPDAPANWYRENVDGMTLFRYNRVGEMREVMRQMKAYNRERGDRAGINQVTYRYKVPNPQGSSIVRGWLDKIGCPVPIIQWACETNPPIWFYIRVKEFNAYMQMVYPQVKLDPVVEGVDDPSDDLLSTLKPAVVCPKCKAKAEIGYGPEKMWTHPAAPIRYDSEVPIARYLSPEDEADPNVSIHHFDVKHVYKCQNCGERFDGTQHTYRVESVDDPDDPQAFLQSYRHTYYKLFYGSKFGEGAFVGVYRTLDDVVQAAKERKLRKRARYVWAVEESHPDAPDDVFVSSEPTGIVYDILKGYTVGEPRRVVIESVDDPDDPEMFIKRFKPRWDLLSHIKNGHFYFKDEAGRIAVADYSMRNQRDPASADDGLLVLDKTKPITRYRGIEGRKMWHIPVTQYYGGLGDKPIPSATGASEAEMADLRPKLEELGWTFQIREEDEDIDPKQYLDATTGWIDTFLNAGMTPNTEDTHRGQFWKRYECHGFNYIVVVNSRVPRFMIVERNDALYGTNTFRRVFEYPDRDTNGLVTEFTALNRLLTKALTSAFDGFPAFDEKVDQLYKQHKRRRQRWLDGKIKEAVDDPEVQRYLDQASPEACKSCGNDLTKRHTVVRQYVQNNGLVHELSGHYDAKDSGYENDEQPDANLLAVLPVCPTFGDICARCGKDPNIPPQQESLDEPEQYLKGNVYTFDELRTKLETYGLSFPSNGISPWGRWAVIDGFTYWAVYSKDPNKYLPQSYFREQLEKFCKEMGFTVYHIQLFGEYPEGITFKLAVPKMQVDPEAYASQERRLNDPDFENQRQAHDTIQRDWLPEDAPDDPDDPNVNIDRHMASMDIDQIMDRLGFSKTLPSWKCADPEYCWYQRYTRGLRVTVIRASDEEPQMFNVTFSKLQMMNYGDRGTFPEYKEVAGFKTHIGELEAKLRQFLRTGKLRLREGELPPEDEPAPNIEKHAQHVEKVEADAIESAILNATNEFDTLVRLRSIDNARRADELAAELGAKWAETAGYPNGSDEFDIVVSAVNNHCGEMFPGQWEDYPESDYPFQEALDDPDDPQAFLQHMETDWRKILRKHGFKPHPHSDHLSYTLEYPDRVWGANWPMRIYAGHGWNPEPEFQYDHPDPDNPDLDAEDAAYEQWERDHGLAAEINRRDVNFPHYVYFQFGREYYRRVEVPTNKLDNFLARLTRGAKKIVGTEHIDHDHPETSDLTTMLWNLAKQIARELQIPLKESLDAPPEDEVNPEAYLRHLSEINLTDLYQQYDLQSNAEGNYGHGLMELGKPATLVWHGKTHTIEKVNLAIHTHPFRQVVSVSIYIRPISNEASWRTLKDIKWHFWSVPVEELRDVVHKMIFEIEGVCLVNDLTWPEMIVQFKTAMKRFRPYRPLVAKKKKVVEGIDDPTPEFMQAAFDVPATLKRMGYERSTREEIPFEWFKVFHRMPTDLDIMVEVKRRGVGGEENEADIVYDITVYRYPVNDNPGKQWVPVAYRYERNNKQLERVLLKLEDRIRRNDLRGIRTDESVPEPPPEDDPTDVIRSHEQSLLPAELKRLDFGPKPEHNKEWIYGVEMPRYWWNKYQATDGKTHGLSLYFFGGQTPEVRANNWNFDAKAWFQRGGDAPATAPAQSEAHFCAIIRDLDAAMKRSAADSLSPEQEHEAIESVLKHHRKWWDDTLDYLINTKGGTVPGRIGPGQPA